MPYLTVAEQRLEYEWIGPRPDERPTLVFLHEGLGCLGMWGNFPARVASDTNCGAFVYSRSGYGDSTPLERPRTPRYLHQEALHVLPEVLHAMGIEQSVLIGHSDGASIALIYAGGTPAPATCGLVLEAPHVFVEDITIEGVRKAGELYRSTDLSQNSPVTTVIRPTPFSGAGTTPGSAPSFVIGTSRSICPASIARCYLSRVRTTSTAHSDRSRRFDPRLRGQPS